MGTIYILLVCFALPILGAIALHMHYKIKYRYFIMGMIAFYVSQIVLRLPLLNYLQTQAFYFTFMMETVPYLLFLSLSAGVFEECARAIMMLFMRRHNGMKKAVMFGLGHGGIEAMLLVGIPLLTQSIDLPTGLLAGSERVLAISAHVCLSMIVWKGVRDHKPCYVLYAILAHGAFNFLPIYLGILFHLSSWAIEGCLLIVTLILVGAVYYGIIEREKR